MSDNAPPTAAFVLDAHGAPHATELTRGPWDPGHQHAGPPIALLCRAIEQAAVPQGLRHVARLTANLLRPVPIGPLRIEVTPDYVGRNAAHYAASLTVQGKECVRVTALVQREMDMPVPPEALEHPLPGPPSPLAACGPAHFPFANKEQLGYGDLVENRSVDGRIFRGACQVWFRMRHPLVQGEETSPYQRVFVAADSGNGVSAVLDYRRYAFVNSDLTVNLIRRPVGEWVCLDARTALGGNGCGLAESSLYDEQGLIGRATQSLVVRPRS